MSLSEHEAEERLAALRRQREALDREIADLVLYLELGRRLNASPARHDPPPAGAPFPAPPPVATGAIRTPVGEEPVPSRAYPVFDTQADPAVAATPADVDRPVRQPAAPEPVAFAEDPTGARRYGRALVEAACGIIAAAGRPLHAREIHDALIVRGFAIPGRDPVASLNTRLWKRSGDGGPLRRHGEAVYGLAGD